MKATPSIRAGVRARVITFSIITLLMIAVVSIVFRTTHTNAAASELFISEYVEGSGNSKAIEIYNGTGASVDLAAGSYNLQYYFNGSTSAGLTINLTGTVANGDVFVVAQSSADAAILAQADQTNGSGWFNGDDAVVLRKGTTIIDVIGQIGADPGSEWGGGNTSTADNTIRRKSTICAGDTDGSNVFDPSVEWDGFANNTFDGLGAHTASCGSVNQPVTPTCPMNLSTMSGSAASTGVSATDADGKVTGATIASITPLNPGTISLGSFVAAASTGGTATAQLNVGAATPPGVYSVKITWSNDDAPTPQTADCTVNVQVNPGGTTFIHTIQGTVETPNFSGLNVMIEGIVVGTVPGFGGFFVEEEDADWDGDANTSEGIFIFDPDLSPAVAIGDKVQVTGTVGNFPVNPGATQLTSVSINIVSSGNPLPSSVTIALPVATTPEAAFEKVEGMRVNFTQTLYVTENFSLGRFGELGLSTQRLYIPTNEVDPNDSPASGTTTSGNSNAAGVAALAAYNDRNQIVLDDGTTQQNPNPIPFIGPGDSTIRLGDSVANLSGVMHFGFGVYRIEPNTAPSFTSLNPRPASPDPVGGTVKVASYNVLNFFATTGGRGASNAAELTRQLGKLIPSLVALDADVIGLVELEKGTAATPDAAVNLLVAELNAVLGAGTYAAVATPAAIYDPVSPVGTDTEIKSGMIYRPARVMPVGAPLTDTVAPVGTYSRAPIAQMFREIATGEQFSVVVNHLRSKSCTGSPAGEDADESTGQGCYNARRRDQVLKMLDFVNASLVPVDPDVVVVGDFNSYAQEDPIDAMRAAGLVDLIEAFVPAGSRYSFLFQSEVGLLDHAFVTPSLASKATGSTVWHINSDEPFVFDYNTEFKTDDRYFPTPYRAADHDPLLLGFQFTNRPAGGAMAVSTSGGTVVCTGGGDVVQVTATIPNNTVAGQTTTFTASLPPQLLALPGTCEVGTGTCNVVDASTVTWTGTIPAGGSVTIRYKAQIADGLPPSTQACITSTSKLGALSPESFTACIRTDCPATGPGTPIPTENGVANDQKPGSILIYNLFTSSTNANLENTRINLTNIDPSRNAYVHLFFVDGASCSVADMFICLTPNQTTSFLASDFDPGTTGYLVAVAVDADGCPVNFNYLIGDAYVKFASGHAANLSAISVAARAGGLPACGGFSVETALRFDGISYDVLPQVLAADNIPSRVDGNETMLVLNRIGGNLAIGAARLAPLFGLLYDDAENGLSFTLNPGTCQYRVVLSNTAPRTVPRFEQFIPAGRGGWMKLWQTGGAFGMTGSMINFNPNAAAAGNAFNQGHNLHVLTTTSSMSYTIPVFPAGC
ncbi:MAG: ExeM/NucH family extracellular endonuclease [Blastocatellales bacterium]